jgi:peptidoglycan/LPS O-acetylase OafA/YrhL
MSRDLNQPVQGLRGTSILLVFFSHWYAGLSAAGLYPATLDRYHVPLFNLGKYGVELFFMISGFVIVRSLRRHATIGSFLIDRIARIYPLFFALHVLVFVAGPLSGHKFFAGVDAGEWLWLFVVNLLLLPGLFDLPIAQIVAWSLSYEVGFYVLAAAAMALLRRPARGRWLAWVAWGAVAGLMLYQHPRTFFFIPGVLAATHGPRLARLLGGLPGYLVPLWLGVYFLLWGMLDPAQGQNLAALVGADLWRALAFGGGFLAGALFFWQVAVRPETRAARFFAVPPMVRLGDISYSFYLWHLFVIVALRPLFRLFVVPATGELAGFWLFGIVALAGTVVVSQWSRSVLEVRAGGTLRDWLRTRLERR